MSSEVLERVPLLGRWLRRRYVEGWDNGIRDAAYSVDYLLEQHSEATIPRAAVKDLSARLYAELEEDT